MSNRKFHLFSVVEGHGEVTAVPKLLYKIWPHKLSEVPALRTDETPHFINRDRFLKKVLDRKKCLNIVRHLASQQHGNNGVLILFDADNDCCKDFLGRDEIKTVLADINSILDGIPNLFVLAEKGYESWLVAGMGGDGSGNPAKWLEENPDKSGLNGSYKKTVDQHKLTTSELFDIDLAAEKNASFKRLQEWLLDIARTSVQQNSK